MKHLKLFRKTDFYSPHILLAWPAFIMLVMVTSLSPAEETVRSTTSTSEVWVPAEAIASDRFVLQESSRESASGWSDPGFAFGETPSIIKNSRSGMRLVDYEVSITPDPVGPAPALTDSMTVDPPSEDFSSDPGLIVPIEEMGPALQIGPSIQMGSTFTSETMVPGSLRVLPASDSVTIDTAGEVWHWEILPPGLLWHSYLAGPREPRISSTFFHIKDQQNYWDATIGGRASLLRYGTTNLLSPEGVEVQVEAAAFPRLTLDYDRDLVACDYRFGFPLVYHRGPLEAKFSYYHLSSHLGDEYLIRHPEALQERINYSRDALTLAVGYFPWRDLRLYGEVGYAVWADGGSRPWEFQFGADYSPARPTGIWGAPFFAVNGHLHQELNYSGGLTCQTGVQWRGPTGRLLRVGFQYFNGMSAQYQFYRQFEQQLGGGIWYDF